MKLLLLAILFCTASFAEKQLMVDSTIPLTTYNHRLSLKMQKEAQMKRLVKVTPERLEKETEIQSGEKLLSKKLRHRGQLLYFRVTTAHCLLEINALDAALISKGCRK